MGVVKTGYIDFALNVIKEISSTEPVLFQRDGSLYVASEKGFGQITYVLHTLPENVEKRRQPLEIAESENAIHRWYKDGYHEKPAFKKSEKPYLEKICCGPDGKSFSLEEITKNAQELAKLKDDGKIRMVLKGNCYRAHKYGYYGKYVTKFSARAARVMDKKKYLGIIRDKEKKILNKLEEYYNIPDCVILTPYIMVSVPRGGLLNISGTLNNLNSWTKTSRLEPYYGRGSILRSRKVNIYTESPFGVNAYLNTQFFNASNTQTFEKKSQDIMERTEKELSVVKSNLDLISEYVERLNKTHNNLCAKHIKYKKEHWN
ncbi:hypothetical protein JW949_02045 [Candidatus Woesearchaeota archaeon]|nr:hypothetical protein [Candidatus Woesearchaeota archaeon]